MRYPVDATTKALSVLVVFTAFAGDFWRNLLGWWGYLALVAAITAAVAVLMTRRGLWRRLDPRRLPRTLLLLATLMVLSLAWSAYPGATVLGILAQAATTLCALFLAVANGWPQLALAASRAFTAILGLSVAFELVAAIFVRQPVLPFFTDYSGQKVPNAFYWTQADLFTGGPIQGIVGNRNLLAFVALLALVTVGVLLAQKLVRTRPAVAWLVTAVVVLALTRSATVIAALVVTAGMLGVLLLARRVGPGRRMGVAVATAALAVAAVVAVSASWSTLLGLFGKSDDLTGRVDIWNSVVSLASERPVFGWGWVSYWVPWVEPFDGLAVRNGVTYLQAHDAWLDVWLQLGFVGLALFAFFVLGSWHRSWWFAVDTSLDGRGRPLPHLAVTLAPALILTALLVQSLVESRLLVEGGWLLLVAIGVKSKIEQTDVGLDLTGIETVPKAAPVATAP
ncbi:O-antigen ligase family protein [Herbiconiux moechotypicola]|uniref:O-antigen ligase-related domain-containing protein n=1 Tax=Herbiconiux moechotypicola TaxID=637393 RepID=A0ABN3DV03_9MICO|nr:O-antigen ligase family protein [Herbiconiux moechotypicola]MCS5731030.1 O-antigen ligase family protein [Herbiconiux moechotypicola]